MPRASTLRRLSTLILLAGLPTALAAQGTGKKPLDHDAYDRWNSLGSQTLARNGQWLAYTLTPGDGDGRLVLRGIRGGRGGPELSVERGTGPAMTHDSRFLVFTIDPMQAVVDSLEKEGKRGDALPRDSLAILELARAFGTGGAPGAEPLKVARVKGWRLPAEGGAFLAYHLEKPETTDSTASGGEERGARTGAARGGAAARAGGEGQDTTGAARNRRKDEGTPLVLRNLASGEEHRFEDVMAFAFTRDGSWLVYTASNGDGTADGVFAVRTAIGEATPLLTGEGKYTQLALSDDGLQAAFLTNRDDWEAETPAVTLYHARLGEGEARAVATQGTPGIPQGWWIREGGSVSFSDKGTRVLFETQPRPPEEPEDTVPDDEKVELDVWNWKDRLIQPMQLVQANRERNRGYQAYASTQDGTVVQLATEEMPDVSLYQGGEGSLALGSASLKYGWWVSHDGTYRDIYLVDMATGRADLVREFESSAGSFSPGGRYVSWFDGGEKAWMVMDLQDRSVRNVSAALPFPVHNELDDHPDEPGSYGSAGWLEGDAALLIYDRFDIWSVDPRGERAPRNLTEGVGRANDIRFRYVNMDRRGGGGFRGSGGSEGIDPAQDALLEAFHLYTKQSGFYRDRFDGGREPQRLLMGDFDYGTPTKAEEADLYVLSRSTFQEYPDLWLSDPDFRNMEKVTDANPQQAEYSWGSAEILEWVSNDGIPLQGILIKPEGFDPSRKYPMMVYFYERNSDGLHRYVTPSAGGSSINYSFYVSRGYVLFVPDIPYEIGHPGESAIDAVVPGVLKLLDLGFVDSKRIGVQGHSWGGYQIAYMVTRTNIFAAAEAGAPVANMTSAYGGIRWGTGMSRQFQYEKTQSRIGGTLWEETLRYIENSPLFEADKVTTPLLMMHNDQDDAVPWYQGIEMFMALRRLQKPVWLLNYNGEPHGLRKEQNRKDFAIRMQQFFDHYLMDAPEPVWMAEGVPAVMKGKTLGLDLVKNGGK